MSQSYCNVDAGPIVTQESVPVYENDDTDSLKNRVLTEAEFAAYPRAVRWFAEDRLTIEGDGENRRVRVTGDEHGDFPSRRTKNGERVTELRYGENPHQSAALYADATSEEGSYELL